MDINIKVLSSGYFITIKEGEEIIDEVACNHGAHNLGNILKKHLYADFETRPKKSKKKTAKKSVKKVNKRKL